MPKSTRGGKRAGGTISNSQGEKIKIKNETDVWSERHKKSQEAAADQILGATRDMNDEYGVMDNVETVTVADVDKQNVIAFYSNSDNKMVMNRKFTDIPTIEASYENCVKNGFHPPVGKRTAIEAVTAHELGHAIADKINEARRKGGYSTSEANSEIVINAFRAAYPSKGNSLIELTKARKSISGYALTNYHETVAEAVADVYCNGGRARKFSKAVVQELKKTIKNEL